MAAIGGCLTVNWGRLIKKMRLDVRGFEVEVKGWRGFDEPQLKEITYKITVSTNEDEKKIMRVKELAEKYGTVFNTVGAEKIGGSGDSKASGLKSLHFAFLINFEAGPKETPYSLCP
ncbi:OsmC family protein [Thermococcus alcaliphilus]|nr:OsmC family protein [Thermococcus alcaliphilus]MCO6040670.1 OsmC family protein [Thermococcus alcaliphilus]